MPWSRAIYYRRGSGDQSGRPMLGHDEKYDARQACGAVGESLTRGRIKRELAWPLSGGKWYVPASSKRIRRALAWPIYFAALIHPPCSGPSVLAANFADGPLSWLRRPHFALGGRL